MKWLLVWFIYGPPGRAIDATSRGLDTNLGSFLAILASVTGGIGIGLALAAVMVWGVNPCGPVFWGH
jgi:hypothetical protein